MKIELKPHIGITFEGKERDNQQWQIFADDRLIGYLPYPDNSQILPVYKFPYDHEKEVIQKCIAERARHKRPSGVVGPRHELKVMEEILADEFAKLEESDEQS